MRSVVLPAVVLGLAATLAVAPVAAAAPTRLVVGGSEYARFEKLPSTPLIDRYFTRIADIGAGFHPGTGVVVIDYPASLFDPGTPGDHIGIGADNLDAAIKSSPGPVVAVGESEGSMVLDAEQARLEVDPLAPAVDRLSFLLFNDPGRGIVKTLFREGVRIPVIGVTATSPAESRYNTVVVMHEYDLWSDFPDRPWNIPALLNAFMGSFFVHPLATGVPADLAPENITTTVNSKSATETTYFVPAPNLPLNEPLRILGVPDRLVDKLDKAMRPIIDAGYSRNDAPGDPRPYLDHGVLHSKRNPASGAVARKAPDGYVKRSLRNSSTRLRAS